MIFPANQYKDDVTLYMPYDDPNTGRVHFVRKTLTRCFWQEDSIAVSKRGGVATPLQVALNIPVRHNPGYVPYGCWKPDMDAWTVRTGGDIERTMILLSHVRYEQLETPQNRERMQSIVSDLRRELLKRIKEPKDVNAILFGPSGMHRVVVSC